MSLKAENISRAFHLHLTLIQQGDFKDPLWAADYTLTINVLNWVGAKENLDLVD